TRFSEAAQLSRTHAARCRRRVAVSWKVGLCRCKWPICHPFFESKARIFVASKIYHNLIGGEWLPSVSGQTLQNINPADHSDIVGIFPASNAEDVALAVAAAKK